MSGRLAQFTAPYRTLTRRLAAACLETWHESSWLILRKTRAGWNVLAYRIDPRLG